MEEPLSPREFLRRYHLPQLVRINEAHLHQLNKSRIGSGPTTVGAGGDPQTRTRSLDSNGTTVTSGSSASSSYNKTNGNHTIAHRVPSRHHLNHHDHMTAEDMVHQMMMTNPAKPQNKSKSHSKASSKVTSNKSQQSQQTMLDGQLLDLDQPFLLYKAYSCRQVIATTLAPDASNDPANYRRAGPSLLIPESYTGKLPVCELSILNQKPKYTHTTPFNY